MSVNLETHITAPDLIEPVIGFRSWTYVEPHGHIPAEYREVGKKAYEPFVAPREYVTLPDGKVTLNMKAVGEAWMKWRDSIYGDGKKVLIRGELEATDGYIQSRGTFMWGPGQNEAGPCQKLGHIAPHHDCECGLYCYYNPEKVSGRQCMGIVSCTGTIEAHVTGMRSQYMKIEHLFGGPNLQVMAERWEIPFTNTHQFGTGKDINKAMKATAQEYGSVLPESMRPKAKSNEDILDQYQRAFDRLLRDKMRERQAQAGRYEKEKDREARGIFQTSPGSHHWGSNKPNKQIFTLEEKKRLMETSMRDYEKIMQDILGGQS